MARARVTGFGIGPLGSIQIEYVKTNKDLARRVVVFLEDRRLLTEIHESRDPESVYYTRMSAQDIRDFLTMEIQNVKGGGELEAAFNEMRKVCRNFITAAGPDSRRFADDLKYFEVCLQSLRDVFGQELLWLEEDFGVTLPGSLKAITP